MEKELSHEFRGAWDGCGRGLKYNTTIKLLLKFSQQYLIYIYCTKDKIDLNDKYL